MAKSKLEISKLIRFGIEQLSPQNGQMDFEHICRQFARSRIHTNILPATGPVQSGGDQGRDFETFHSYMASSPIAQTSFVGLFSEYPVAFACSLQKELIKSGKIDGDIATILSSGTKVEHIYFFSGQDISVAERHKCQARILRDKSLSLDIIDATALAEHLSDPDLFWIANRYLDIPNDYYPVQEDTGWYADIKAAFKGQDESYRTPTFEEFSEIKSALRKIYKDDQRKVDLPFWFQKLQLYLVDGVFRPLQRKAIYEQFVANLVGQNDLSGQEELVRNYFSDFRQYATPAVLEDDTILLSFIISSKGVIGHSITDEEISKWRDELWQVLENEYTNTSDAGRKVWLAVIRGHYQFQVAKRDTIEQGISAFINAV